MNYNTVSFLGFWRGLCITRFQLYYLEDTKDLFLYIVIVQDGTNTLLYRLTVGIAAKCMIALIRSVFSQRNQPIIMQDSDYTCVPQLKLYPFCMMIGHFGWGKIDMIRALELRSAMLWMLTSNCRFVLSRLHSTISFYSILCCLG